MRYAELQDRIRELRATARNGDGPPTWEEIRQLVVVPAMLDRVSRACVWKIANQAGYEPKDLAIREALDLDEESPVRYVDGRARPKAQALDVMACIDCSRYFVSNHPRRQRCFICSPYRGQRTMSTSTTKGRCDEQETQSR